MMSDPAEMSNECGTEQHSTGDSSGQDVVCCAESGQLNAVTSSDGVAVGVNRVRDPECRRSKLGKRRSGFSRGRVSLTQLSKDSCGVDSDMVGSELYKQIPVELAPAERLSLLTRLQLRYTLEVLDQEFENVPDFDNFKAEALDSVGATLDQMERNGSFQQACTTPSLATNPVNLQMDNTIHALTSYIKRLEKEDGDWDELVSRLEAQAQSAEQQLSQLEVEHTDIPEDVRQLSLSFLPQDPDVPDLSAVCADVSRDLKTISLLMEDYCHSVELLNIVHRAAARHMDRLTTTLVEVSGCQTCDPKESIQQLLSC